MSAIKRDRDEEPVSNGNTGGDTKRTKIKPDIDEPEVATTVKQDPDQPNVSQPAADVKPDDNKSDSSLEDIADSDNDDQPVYGNYRMSSKVKKGSECPFLDTISRQNLDFDFEKCCSVSLSPVNVYVCLVCGKYFQGRGPNTQAYTHSLETNHHMFMKLENGKVYCLPEMYEVVDRSLDDIRYVLNPQLTKDEVNHLDNAINWSRALDGTEYMPGLVGLNNMKNNDYVNVVIQMLARIKPIRDFFLIPANYAHCKSLLVQRFGELLRKVWNPRNFKGQVSPHELMQAVMTASNKRFTIDRQSDPVELWSWLINTLHRDLTGGSRKKTSIITKCLQGVVEVTTEAGTGKAPADSDLVERVPFLQLGLDLPPTPLFKDVMEKNIIPQVPIFDILKKFSGSVVVDNVRTGRQRYKIVKLPKYLIITIKRFTKNNFFIEKNPTIVNFPVKNLDLAHVVDLPPEYVAQGAKYDLIGNVVHDGKAGEGSYRAHVHRKIEDIWYEIQDLTVVDVLPQMVALSEAYMQAYELREPAATK